MDHHSESVPNLLLPEEVASILRISRSQVYHLIQTGDLRSIRIARSVRIKQEDLWDFIEEKRTSLPKVADTCVKKVF